jgi:hypothetical protein
MMKQTIPRLLCLVAGVVMIVQFFIPHAISETIFSESLRWVRIISAFALVLGVRSVVVHHGVKVRRRASGWGYSIVTLVGMTVMAVVGLLGGVDPNAPKLFTPSIGSFSFHMQTLYENLMVPLGATMFATLAFYMASAAYRAFRARNRHLAEDHPRH